MLIANAKTQQQEKYIQVQLFMKAGLPLPLTTGDYQPIRFTFKGSGKIIQLLSVSTQSIKAALTQRKNSIIIISMTYKAADFKIRKNLLLF